MAKGDLIQQLFIFIFLALTKIAGMQRTGFSELNQAPVLSGHSASIEDLDVALNARAGYFESNGYPGGYPNNHEQVRDDSKIT